MNEFEMGYAAEALAIDDDRLRLLDVRSRDRIERLVAFQRSPTGLRLAELILEAEGDIGGDGLMAAVELRAMAEGAVQRQIDPELERFNAEREIRFALDRGEITIYEWSRLLDELDAQAA
jgi:hypothetical protein